MARSLPPDVREFIYRCCASLPARETLVALASEPETRRTAETLQARLPELPVEEARDCSPP